MVGRFGRLTVINRVSNETAVRARGVQGARRGGPGGRLVVGEYVGEPAAEAAQAVRRAGLRPGLERSFGCEPALLGLVVAQEPSAGGALARNGLVTLFVAAPSAAEAEPDNEELRGEEPESDEVSEAAVLEVDAPSARARRSRKPGLAGRAPERFDTPPAPVCPEVEHAEESSAEPLVDAGDGWGDPVRFAGDGSPQDDFDGPLDELAREEFVVHVDDVFAGRGARWGSSWSRVYPRRRSSVGGGVRARVAEHPWLVRVAAGLLAVWALVGVAAALAGHPASERYSSVLSGGTARTPARVIRAPKARPNVRALHPVMRAPRRAARSGRAKGGRRGRRRRASSAVERPPAASAPVSVSPRRAVARAPEPVGTRTPGGLFSP